MRNTMDELTRERYGVLAWWESRRQPEPRHMPVVWVSTEEQQRRRRAELLEAVDGWTTR